MPSSKPCKPVNIAYPRRRKKRTHTTEATMHVVWPLIIRQHMIEIERKQNHLKSKLYIVYTCIFTFYFICPLIQHEYAHFFIYFFLNAYICTMLLFRMLLLFWYKNGISFLLEAVFYSRDGESGKSVESCNRKPRDPCLVL